MLTVAAHPLRLRIVAELAGRTGARAMVAASGHRQVVTARAVGVIAVIAGAVWAISAEWVVIRGGYGAFGYARLQTCRLRVTRWYSSRKWSCSPRPMATR